MREELEILKHHAGLAADLLDLLTAGTLVGREGDLVRTDPDRAEVGCSSRLIERSSVLLPPPEGPISAVTPLRGRSG